MHCRLFGNIPDPYLLDSSSANLPLDHPVATTKSKRLQILPSLPWETQATPVDNHCCTEGCEDEVELGLTQCQTCDQGCLISLSPLPALLYPKAAGVPGKGALCSYYSPWPDFLSSCLMVPRPQPPGVTQQLFFFRPPPSPAFCPPTITVMGAQGSQKSWFLASRRYTQKLRGAGHGA